MNALPEQNTQDWLDWRKNKIGASDIPCILGVGYKTPLQLWRLKLGFEEPEEENYAQKYGRENESRVREMLQIRYGKRIDPVTRQHPTLEWAIASLDGQDDEGDIYEIKCCSKQEYNDSLLGKWPEKYYPQFQWQMFVTDKQFVRYCPFNDGKLNVIEVPRNDVFIENCVLQSSEFYRRLMDYDPPELSEDDYREINDLEFGKFAHEWLEVNEVEKRAAARKKDLKEKLVDFTDDGNCQGYGIKLTRIKANDTVDLEKLYAHYGITQEDLEKFKKPQIGYWRISKMKGS